MLPRRDLLVWGSFRRWQTSKREYDLDFRERNKEALQERAKLYKLENEDDIKLKRRDYYTTLDKTARKQQLRDYYLQNQVTLKERAKKLSRDVFLKHREKVNQRGRKRYLAKKKNKDLYSPRTHSMHKSWKSPALLREYFDALAKELHVLQHTDWYRVSRAQIIRAGGKGLYRKFENIGGALQCAYPEHDWDLTKFSFRGKKSGQRWLRVKVSELLPGIEITEDFLHPELNWEKSDRCVELDIWIPEHNIALEYQGEHHYYNMDEAFGPNGTANLYSTRDLWKISSCLAKGITLIVIPFWWNGEIESLGATLYKARPDVFPVNTGAPIPTEMPASLLKGRICGDSVRVGHLMLGTEWNKSIDPTGWIMTEKFDGYRAYWDGERFLSKKGKLINAPQCFKDLLPKKALDGELWAGFQSIETLTSLLNTASHCTDEEQLRNLWQSIRYCIFDAPYEKGTYLVRRVFMEKAIAGCDLTKISLVPMEVCLGSAHLEAKLKEITMRQGEGIMIHHPEATYTAGRSKHLLKVKGYEEADVTFVRQNPNSYSFVCRQENGANCIVKTSGFDYGNAPAEGRMITVRYDGVWKKSQKLKYPVLLRIRPELE